jgi:hypothetical protein
MADQSIQGRADPIFKRYAEMDFNGAKPVSQVPVLAKLQAEHGALNGLGDLAVVATPQASCPLAQVETLAASTRTDSPIPADSTAIPAKPTFLK